MKKVWMLTHLRLLVLEPMPPGPKDKIGVFANNIQRQTSCFNYLITKYSSGGNPKMPLIQVDASLEFMRIIYS